MLEETAAQDTKWATFKEKVNDYMNGREVKNKIAEMLSANQTRLYVNLDDIRKNSVSSELAQEALRSPLEAVPIFEACLRTAVQEHKAVPSSLKKKTNAPSIEKEPEYKICFEGAFGGSNITPRGLSSATIGQMVRIQGMVTRLTNVKPKLLHSVHYCDQTKMGQSASYTDSFAIDRARRNLTTNNHYPTNERSIMRHPLSPEYGFCKYKDYQTALIQEMPERTPTGMLPRSVEVVFEEDLVDQVKPGDRIQVSGVFMGISSPETGASAVFRTVLVAMGVSSLSAQADAPKFSVEDIKNIRAVAKRRDVFNVLGRSIAPSVHGHEMIKKSILLMLMGGCEKTIEDSGTRLRGDINLLMIGDPSTAKSQLLRHVMNIAPLSVSTTGRGSTGVGLTAAVTVDKESGQKMLEAGAMVLADRGVACIDEFDKMNEEDRVAIHEVMEQQTITISKAGIHTTLNARCAVIAAANPTYGNYQRDMTPAQNISLPDSLLSRFDLTFVVLDQNDEAVDRLIAERVTRNHRYQSAAQERGEMVAMDAREQDVVIEPEYHESGNTAVWEKYNTVLHSEKQETVTIGFLKKYISYVKRSFTPVLTNESKDRITQLWTQLRELEANGGFVGKVKIMPVTIRTLETLIRLSSAHAKLRLSNQIEVTDCEAAYSLLSFALHGEIVEMESRPKPRNEGAMLEENEPLGRKGLKTSSKGAAGKENKEEDNSARVSKAKESNVISKETPTRQSGRKKTKVDEEEEALRVIIEPKTEPKPSIAEEKQREQLVFRTMVELAGKGGRAGSHLTLQELRESLGIPGGQIKDNETLEKILTKFVVDDKICRSHNGQIYFI
jgi:DNA replication licensing factor MCM3